MEGEAQRANALDGNCPALLTQAIESVHKAQRLEKSIQPAGLG
jgi:hypothetical protein